MNAPDISHRARMRAGLGGWRHLVHAMLPLVVIASFACDTKRTDSRDKPEPGHDEGVSRRPYIDAHNTLWTTVFDVKALPPGTNLNSGGVEGGRTFVPVDAAVARAYGYSSVDAVRIAADTVYARAMKTAKRLIGDMPIADHRVIYTPVDLKEKGEEAYCRVLLRRVPVDVESELGVLNFDLLSPYAPILAHEFVQIALRGGENTGNFPPYELTYPGFFSWVPSQLIGPGKKVHPHSTTFDILLANAGVDSRKIIGRLPAQLLSERDERAHEKALARLGKGVAALDPLMAHAVALYLSDPDGWDAANAAAGNNTMLFVRLLEKDALSVPDGLRARLDRLAPTVDKEYLRAFFDPDAHAADSERFPYSAMWSECLKEAQANRRGARHAAGYWIGYFTARGTLHQGRHWAYLGDVEHPHSVFEYSLD